MRKLEEIVGRAIEYTESVLDAMPNYRSTAIDSLRKLRESLARRWPGDPAIEKLDAYLDSLIAGPRP